jgi:hypothetical protein
MDDFGKQGYLVLDNTNSVFSLQEGSVVLAGRAPEVNGVRQYCYYLRDGDKVKLYKVKVKHFDISSDPKIVGEPLIGIVGPDHVEITDEFMGYGRKD